MNFSKSILYYWGFVMILLLVQCKQNQKKDIKKPIPKVVFSVKEKAVTDIDGNVYSSVTINGNEWMTSNLRVTRLNDGTPLDYTPGNENWSTYINKMYYCWANNDSTMKTPYGAYYTRNVVDTKKLCPVGWHVASTDEWRENVYYYTRDKLKDKEYVKNLKASTDWPYHYLGTNKYKLDVYPASYRDEKGVVVDFKESALFWTIDENEFDYTAAVFTNGNTFGIRILDGHWGLSVRCVKNKN